MPPLMEEMMSPFACVRDALAGHCGRRVVRGDRDLGNDASAQSTAKEKIPELASSTFAWLAAGADWRDPPAGMRGPIRHDPDYRYHGNLDGPGQVTVRLGNWKDPVLKPWAAQQMHESNEEVLSGKRQVPFAAQARCYPGGVPGQLLYPGGAVLFHSDAEGRLHDLAARPYGAPHLPHRQAFGEGEAVVVRRVDRPLREWRYAVSSTPSGCPTKNSYIDNFRTPHTEKLHVTERIKLAADGRTIEAFVTVNDPDTFNETLYLVQRWRKVPNPLLETVCAENNEDHFDQGLFPIPRADKPDF